MFVIEGDEFGSGDGGTVEVALEDFAAQGIELVPLGDVVHEFGYDVQMQGFCELDQRGDDFLAVGVG